MATRAKRRTASTTKTAKPSVGSMGLATIKPTVTFLHGDGSVAESNARALRKHTKTGQFCVERRGRLLPILRIVDERNIEVGLTATPIEAGYADAQAIAPVVTNVTIGLPKGKKPAFLSKSKTSAKTSQRRGAAAEGSAPTIESVAAQLASMLKGQSPEVAAMTFTSILNGTKED